MISSVMFFFKDALRFLLFFSVTLCFKETYALGVATFGIISSIYFYKLYREQVAENEFFETYFLLLIYSSVFSGSIHKIILIILLLFLLKTRIQKKEVHKKVNVYKEQLFIVLFGILFINHALFPPYFNGLDIFIYFLLIPILFLGIKKFNFKISFSSAIKVFITSVFIASIILIFLNLVTGKLITTTHTYFPESIELTHVYFGIFLGLSNCLLLVMHSQKQRFINVPLDSFLFVFNCSLVTYIGARMTLLSILFVLLIFIFNKVPYKLIFKISFISVAFVGLLFFGSKIPRIAQGVNEIETLYTSVETNDKENIVMNSWKNMYMRYLVTSYTLEEIKDNWFLGIGMQNVEKQISNKIIADGYKYFIGINPHNQYLHFFVGLGIFGFLYFLYLIIYLLRSHTISIYVLLFFLSVMLTESILVRGKGILVFTFFTLLLLNKKQIADEDYTHS